MHVLSKRPLREFWSVHPDAERPLRAWHQAARREDWVNFAEVRARFPHADRVGRFTVFNIGGNKYRLIAVIHYNRGKVFVRHVLTHKEYDRGSTTVATGKTTNRLPGKARALTASYLTLIRRFPLRPITSEAELDRATAVMNSLLDRDLDSAEDDYLDVLSDLIERYEDKHHPIGDVSEDEMLAFLIEQKGVTQVEAARGAGIAESTVSEVLSGKRQLTRGQIEKLASYFHVSPAVFLPETGNGRNKPHAAKGR